MDYPLKKYEIRTTMPFKHWYEALDIREAESVSATVAVLGHFGPTLRYPLSSKVLGSRHGRMRELRVQHQGRPLRIFYAFDPDRAAILLIGGDKTGDKRFYDRLIPIADRLYEEHIDEIAKAPNEPKPKK
jgi:hypothetical protein